MVNLLNETLFPPDLWETALAKYGTAANLTVQLFDTRERAVLGPLHPTPLYGLFTATRANLRFFTRCARAALVRPHHDFAAQVVQFHGLSAVTAPLVLEGEVVGAAVAGYVFTEFPQVSQIRWLAREAGIAFEALWRVARKQQPVPERRLRVRGELLQTLGEGLLRENLRTRQYQHADAIITSSGDAIISENLYGVVTAWNIGAERLYGYSAAEALGKPVTQLLTPPGRMDEEPGILRRIRDGGSIDHFETVGRRKNGTLLDVSLSVSPITNLGGRIVGASKIARNITERKLAEEALRLSHEQVKRARDYAEATLRTSPVPLLVLEADLRVYSANEAFYAAFKVGAAARVSVLLSSAKPRGG